MPGLPGWRALARFWVVLLAVIGIGGAVLDRMGPPPPAGTGAGPAEGVPVAASAMPRAEPTAPPAGPAAAPAPPSTPSDPPAQTSAAALPLAPEPPPLTEAATRAATAAVRPIPPPDPTLLEFRGQNALPRVGSDGRTSIRAYGHPFDRTNTRPRVGLIIGSIGLSLPLTEDAIRRLPPEIGLSLSPYAPRLDAVAERARARGMEMLISLPLEPTGYPLNDPGDQALLTGLSLGENLNRLDWSLMRSQGYVGVVGALGAMRGERFAAMSELLGTVQDVLRTRGLLYIEPRPGAPQPARAWGRAVDIVVDEPATRGEIERRLGELERVAKERGSALGLAGDPSPVLVERVVAWAQGLEQRGLALAPVSAMIRRPEGIPPAAAAEPVRAAGDRR